MKLLINAAGISATGPIQVTISFLQECISFNQHEYHILSSKTLSKEINKRRLCYLSFLCFRNKLKYYNILIFIKVNLFHNFAIE